MSGIEALGAIAAVSQITVYLGRLVQELAHVRQDLKDAFERFSAQDQQLEELAQTLHSLQNYRWLPDHLVRASLEPIEARIDAIRRIVSRWASKSTRKHGIKSVFVSRSLQRACQQIETNFRDLDSLKTTLLLHISAWNSNTLYKIEHLSLANNNALELLSVDKFSRFEETDLDMSKWNQWFRPEKSNIEDMKNKSNTKRLLKKTPNSQLKDMPADLEAVMDDADNEVENAFAKVNAKLIDAAERSQAQPWVVSRPKASLDSANTSYSENLQSEGTNNSEIKNSSVGHGEIRAVLENNHIDGNNNEKATTGAKIRGPVPKIDVKVKDGWVKGDDNIGVTTGLDVAKE